MGILSMEARTVFLLKGMFGFMMMMHAPTKCIWRTAACWLLYTLASSSLNLGVDDGVFYMVILGGLGYVPFLYKRILTIAATYPLALGFKYVAKILPKYSLKEEDFFTADGCSKEVAERRKAALLELSERWKKKFPQCRDFADQLRQMFADLTFTTGRCFPCFNQVVNSYLDPTMAVDRTEGVDVIDVDNNRFIDVSGSYGVNVCGYDQYKAFMEKGWDHAKKLGLFLPSLDKLVLENMLMIRKYSGHDEVSFHMSGTEAVMAAVRCARFNTRKRYVVTFGGAYHGWWDGMQPYVGNERTPNDVLCLKDMNQLSLKVISLRGNEIAAVLVNPLQCFHINQTPPGDPVLSTNNRKVGTTEGYGEWLHQLRDACTSAGVVLIFDEVYTGFRLHPCGGQGAYNVKADIVCYGKTLGGGLPIGVVCGPNHLMAKSDQEKATRVAYVIGTFAGHPYVMACMNEFLKWLEKEETIRKYDEMQKLIDSFIAKANKAFKEKDYPIEVTNWYSVWSILYKKPGRYHWMLQYYTRDAGINMSWVGSGRLLFSFEWKQEDFDRLLEKLLSACEEMTKGGWWEPPVLDIKKRLGREVGGAVLKSFFGSLKLSSLMQTIIQLF